jgi:coenzyme F420-reducing hydrogenase delta subunit
MCGLMTGSGNGTERIQEQADHRRDRCIVRGSVIRMSDFEPKIVAFCCNWCSYAGADGAGVARLQMPTNFRIIRTMCSARVDPEFILRSLAKGADGVIVLGCHPADCHYIGGNYRARRRIALLRMVLEQYGFDPKRLKLEWVSASEGEKFQNTITSFVTTIKELGPTPFVQEVK